ncbi:hypothetical protein ACHWQZ_G012171 [Mnemiopsis leidyi]
MKREQDDDVVQQQNKRPKPDDRALRVGLCEYVNHGFDPLHGEFKSRMEDFMVTEIYRLGTECQLKSFDIPALLIEEETKEENLCQHVELSEETVVGLNKILSKELQSFFIPAPANKEDRTSLHKSIGKFNEALSTETTKDGNDSVIKVTLKRRGGFGNRDKRSDKNNHYLHFTILKWNMTTGDAVLRLAKQLNIKPKNISYAGLKDKRGITSQRMCCRFLEPKRLVGINRSFFGANSSSGDPVVFKNSFIMGDFEFSKKGINLGDLCGNRFSIVLRDCKETTSENLEKVKHSLLKNGFLNYFGLQRFGNNGDTHKVGKHILRKDYQSAVELILTPNNNTKKDVVASLNHYKTTSDAAAALAKLSYKASIEGLILSSLAKEPNNFKLALKRLHHKQQTLYTHAYQSYVWNNLVSRRIRTHGTAVLAGDLVYECGEENEGPVRTLRREEVSNYDLSDILLPLPGYDVQLPDNCCTGFLNEILEEDDMSIEDFKGPLGKEFNVGGCYRNVLFKPSEFEANIVKYSEENEKLVSTNLDSVLGREFSVKNEGSRTALMLSFTLPRSCYATMLLREIMRSDDV